MNPEPRQECDAVSGLILAGGASSRFGEPKALALLHGKPLVSWVAAALAPSCNEIVVSISVEGDEERYQSALPAVRIVRDHRSDRGPIEGLRRGIEAARCGTVAVAPCDAPLLQPSLYLALLDLLRGHEAAVPRLSVFDPVRAVYDRQAVLRILGQEREIWSPSSLVDRLDAAFLEGVSLLRADARLASFIDVNRRQDLERAFPIALDVLRATSRGPPASPSATLG